MDPQIQQKLRKAQEEVAELAATAKATKTVTVREILADIAKVEGLSANGKAILEKVLGAESFEDKTTLTLTIELYTDPWQLKPTSTEVTPSGLPGTGQGSFASNEAIVLKSKELGATVQTAIDSLAKDLEGKTDKGLPELREAITKAGPATSKLEQIKDILKLDGAVDNYDLRWRAGEVIGLLAQFAQVEAILTDVSKADAKPTEKKPTTKAAVWPSNMAAASYDKDHGVFKRDDLTWGHDDGLAPR